MRVLVSGAAAPAAGDAMAGDEVLLHFVGSSRGGAAGQTELEAVGEDAGVTLVDARRLRQDAAHLPHALSRRRRYVGGRAEAAL